MLYYWAMLLKHSCSREEPRQSNM